MSSFCILPTTTLFCLMLRGWSSNWLSSNKKTANSEPIFNCKNLGPKSSRRKRWSSAKYLNSNSADMCKTAENWKKNFNSRWQWPKKQSDSKWRSRGRVGSRKRWSSKQPGWVRCRVYTKRWSCGRKGITSRWDSSLWFRRVKILKPWMIDYSLFCYAIAT